MRLLCGLLFLCLLAGCSSTPIDSIAGSVKASEGGLARQVVREISLTVEVERLQESIQAMQQNVRQYGGYVTNLDQRGDQGARLVCRIPQKKTTAFVDQSKKLGTVLNESRSEDDITEEVTSVGVGLQNLYALRQRMLALLQKTEKVSEILEVERELNRIQTRIDYLEKERKEQSGQVAYSGVTIHLQKKSDRILGPLGMLAYGLYWTVEKLFVIR